MRNYSVYMEEKQSHDIAMRFVLQLMVEVKGTCGNVSNIKSVTTVSTGMVSGALKDLHLSNMFFVVSADSRLPTWNTKKGCHKMHALLYSDAGVYIVMQGCSFHL